MTTRFAFVCGLLVAIVGESSLATLIHDPQSSFFWTGTNTDYGLACLGLIACTVVLLAIFGDWGSKESGSA